MPLSTDYLNNLPESPRDLSPFCLACGYNLTGAVSERCPECGQFFVRKDWEREKVRIKGRIAEAEEAFEWVRFALKVLAFGVVVILPGSLSGSSIISGLSRFIGIACGVCTFFLGLGGLRATRLPKWVRERFGVTFDPNLIILAIVLGAGLAVGGVLMP